MSGGTESRTPRRLPSRRHRRPRCRGCGLHREICVCEHLPRIRLPFDIVILQHAVERDRPTNTGRILHNLLPESRILTTGLREGPPDPAALPPAVDALVLFPAGDAAILRRSDLETRASRTRRTVLLLDGTWSQASHMRRRIALLREIPCVRLPDGPPGRWRIRCAADPDRLCTLEAGIRLVRLAGLRAEAARMDAAQDLIMRRMLYMKGRLPALPPLPDNAF